MVERPRLVEDVLRKLAVGRVVDVVGVAGAGKTTLAAQVAGQVSVPVAWLTLEEWDRSAARFLEDLVEALSEVAPGVTAVLDPTTAATPRSLAAAVGSLLGGREALLVLDDAHLLVEWPGSTSVLGALARSTSGLQLLLVGRQRIVVPGLATDALAARGLVDDGALAADVEEAAAILALRGSDADAASVQAASDGWVTGIVLAATGSPESAYDDLITYLEGAVRPHLSPAEDYFLVCCSVFDVVDRARATALEPDHGQVLLSALRRAGLPGMWRARPVELRMPPLIREQLREALDAGPEERRRAAHLAASRAYEAEGALELSLSAALEAGALDEARRLLPLVIGDVVLRVDLEVATRLLSAVPYAEEPPEIAGARLAVALLEQQATGALPVLAALEDERRFADVSATHPHVGALACVFLAAIGRLEDAVARFETLAASRARDAARYFLSAERDDPEAPIPPFAGDILDVVICHGLYARGRMTDLHRITSSALAGRSGVPELVSRGGANRAPLADCWRRLLDAVSARDLVAARAVVAELEGFEDGSHVWIGLARAQVALRIERDAGRAHEALELARGLPESRNLGLGEEIRMWEGGAHLLAGDERAARVALRDAVASMRRGDRLLHLPTALAYLAEAEWRLGDEDRADRLTAEAYAIAREHGLISPLLLALADVPGVLSRALDLERATDAEWHALGRALVRGRRSPVRTSPSTVAVHVRELGEPLLLLDGVPARPKLRKSLEVLAFLLASPRGEARRPQILAALWGGRDDDSTRAYLRQAVRHLRDVLPPEVVLTTRGDVLSLAGAITSEVAELEALLRAASANAGAAQRTLLLQALAIGQRGVFLEGSDDIGWVDERRAALDASLVTARLDAATTLIEESRLVEALETIDAALARNRLVERGWRLRMQALALLGDSDGVVDALRACRAALAEVGLEPARATTELAARLRS